MGWLSGLKKLSRAVERAGKQASAPPRPKSAKVTRQGPVYNRAPIPLAGDGSFDQEVVGESYNQDALDGLCGGKCEDGHELECRAMLAPEPTNPYDKNAVKVTIRDRKVAHLSRADAIKFHAQMKRLGADPGQPAECSAVIVGGWKRRSGDEGHYGVRLDLTWPLNRS